MLFSFFQLNSNTVPQTLFWAVLCRNQLLFLFFIYIPNTQYRCEHGDFILHSAMNCPFSKSQLRSTSVSLSFRVSGYWGFWMSRTLRVPETPSCTELGAHWLLVCCTFWPPVSRLIWIWTVSVCFHASLLVIAMAGGIVFFEGCPPVMLVNMVSFIIHLDSRMNWIDFGGQGQGSLSVKSTILDFLKGVEWMYKIEMPQYLVSIHSITGYLSFYNKI